MKYFLVGKKGVELPYPGDGTLIRTRRAWWGQRQWSYLYGQDHDGTHRIWWGQWSGTNMLSPSNYPSIREVSEGVALYMIDELSRRLGVPACN